MTPTVFALLVVLSSTWGKGPRMAGVFIVSCLFGGSAAVSLGFLSGAPLTPAVFALPFLLARTIQVTGAGTLTRIATSPRAGLWLFLLVGWGCFGAAIFPRVFAGSLTVLTANRNVADGLVVLAPLVPSSANITQSGYALGGLCAFVTLSALLERDAGLELFKRAVMLTAVLNVVAAVIGLVEATTGSGFIMPLIRNASYAIIDKDEVGGLFRITGTFPESSTFAAFTVPLLAFTSALWRGGTHGHLPGWIALASLSLLAFSTSTTAYAALIVYAGFLFAMAGWQLVARGELPVVRRSIIVLWTASVLACLGLLLGTTYVDSIVEFLQTTLFRKLETSSGIERSSWNAQAWSNFVDTYGLGVGLGGTRASSFPLVVLSNLGVIGAMCFAIFVYKTARSGFERVNDAASSVRVAAVHGMFACLIASSISGTVFDIGMLFYVFAAAAASIERNPAEPEWASGTFGHKRSEAVVGLGSAQGERVRDNFDR